MTAHAATRSLTRVVAAAFCLATGIVACAGSNETAMQPLVRDASSDSSVLDAPTNDESVAPSTCVPVQLGAPADARIPAPYAGQSRPPTASVRRGEALYPIWCARCHGVDARGGGAFDPPASDLTRAARSDAYVFWRITKGGHGDPICSQMPAFETSLSEEERWDLVAYVRSLEPDAEAPDAAPDGD